MTKNVTSSVLIKSIVKNKKDRSKNTASVCFDNRVKEKLDEVSEENEISISYIVNEIVKRALL